VQRRHQKIVEETPSPAVDDELRERMGRAAIAAARAAGYVNAGTVEFLLDGRDFFFLEVNARIQVEHPVTEWLTGVDLVRCQVEVAAGEALPFRQEDVCRRGHAIECRIYAEDPERGFAPSPGRIALARFPEGPGVRCDSGVVSGSDVPVHYDPILAKVAVHAPTRDAAIARLARALEETVILGVRTPIELLLDVVRSAPFAAGRTHTGFLDEHFAAWRPHEDGDRAAAIGFALDRLAAAASPAGAAPTGTPDALSPWRRLGPWGRGTAGGEGG
jgi:acetyl/propionyl-CoA carboxylase alpha subunit